MNGRTSIGETLRIDRLPPDVLRDITDRVDSNINRAALRMTSRAIRNSTARHADTPAARLRARLLKILTNWDFVCEVGLTYAVPATLDAPLRPRGASVLHGPAGEFRLLVQQAQFPDAEFTYTSVTAVMRHLMSVCNFDLPWRVQLRYDGGGYMQSKDMLFDPPSYRRRGSAWED